MTDVVIAKIKKIVFIRVGSFLAVEINGFT
jgi:hypothetical protein